MKKVFFLAVVCAVFPVMAKDEGMSIKVETSQGLVHVYDSGGNGPAVMLIHGNSASGKIFKKQFEAFGKQYRLIAPDLPGHGDSSPALDPQACYSLPGYAKVLAEVIQKLDLKEVVLIGWSLGGHIALEMSVLASLSLKGILITGTPPISLSPEGFKKGFNVFEGLDLVGFEDRFSEDQARSFITCVNGAHMVSNETAFMIQDAIKTQGLARKHMIASLHAGVGTDQVKIVTSMRIPLAIIVGKNDCVINHDSIRNGIYSSLWRQKVHSIEDAGHAVFWEKAEQFNKLVADFLRAVWE